MGSVLTTPLVFYTGASGGLTPFRSDFVTYEKVQFGVKGVVGKGNVIGKGLVLRKFCTRCENVIYISSHAFHMPTAEIRLESPQSLFSKLGGQSQALMDGRAIVWTLPDGKIIDIPIDPMTNLLLLQDFTFSEDEKQNHFGLAVVPPIEVVEPFLADDDGGPLDYEV